MSWRESAARAACDRLYDFARLRRRRWRTRRNGRRARPLLKVKLGGGDDGARIAAVRRARRSAQLIVDANEGWNADNLQQISPPVPTPA